MNFFKGRKKSHIIMFAIVILVLIVFITIAYGLNGSEPILTFADEGKIFETSQPSVFVSIYDAENLDVSSVSMSIDGEQKQGGFTYKNHWDSSLDAYVIDATNEGSLLLVTENLSDGEHTLSVSIKDVSGNLASQSWHFSVAQKPIFSSLTPLSESLVTKASTTIKAYITDPNGTINLNTINLTLNNNQVVPIVSESNGVVEVVYAVDSLSDNLTQSVVLSAKDNSNNLGSVAWGFNVNSQRDAVIGAKECGTCHKLNTYEKYEHTEGPLGITNTNKKHTHFYGNVCSHCHREYSDKTCGYCHGADIIPNVKVPNWRATWVRPAVNPALASGQECIYCHSIYNSGWIPTAFTASRFYLIKSMVNTGVTPLVSARPDIPLKIIHDLMPSHKIEKEFCNQCHSEYLTREHNKKKKTGIQMNCATCHDSADENVKYAIKNNKTDCYDCHKNEVHAGDHATPLDTSCQSCHSGTVIEAHFLSVAEPHSQTGRTCETCHLSNDSKVLKAINIKNIQCSGCHLQSATHNVSFENKIYTDIQQYPGFQWSNPLDNIIFIGDTGFPLGYEDGFKITSNAVQGVSIRSVWNFYSSQLTNSDPAGDNWSLNSVAPALDATNFSAEFTKANSSVIVECSRDGSGQDAFTKIQLWFK